MNPMRLALGACLAWTILLAGCDPAEETCTTGADCNDCQMCAEGVCLPAVELCDDLLDNDCDGTVNEDCADPCASVTCNEQKPAECLDVTTLRTYGATGQCQAGICQYPVTDTPCPLGCDAATRSCKGCDHTCEVSETRCADGGLTSCTVDTNGCRVWGEPVPCPDGLCQSNTACNTCTSDCPAVGATRCAGGEHQECQEVEGCQTWSTPRACASGFCQSESACGECTHLCPEVGQTACTDGQQKTCLADLTGCLAWGEGVPCLSGFCGDETTCGVCENACEPGAVVCAEGKLTTCETDELGCRKWSAPVPCQDGACQDETSCLTCTNQCGSRDELVCKDGALRTCLADEHGCLYLSAAEPCPSGFCADDRSCGACQNGCPQADDLRCTDGVIQTCLADLTGCLAWGADAPCASGVCGDGPTCAFGDLSCQMVGSCLSCCQADPDPCADACAAEASADALGEIDAIGSCMTEHCADACATGAAACPACQQQSCAAEVAACDLGAAGTGTCMDILTCLQSCGATSPLGSGTPEECSADPATACLNACFVDTAPTSLDLFNAVGQCMADHCGAECQNADSACQSCVMSNCMGDLMACLNDS